MLHQMYQPKPKYHNQDTWGGYLPKVQPTPRVVISDDSLSGIISLGLVSGLIGLIGWSADRIYRLECRVGHPLHLTHDATHCDALRFPDFGGWIASETVKDSGNLAKGWPFGGVDFPEP